MAKKKRIRYTPGLIRDLAHEIVDTRTFPSVLCKRKPEKYPTYETLLKWKKEHPKCCEILDAAFTELYEDLNQEYLELSKLDWVPKNIDKYGTERQAFEARKSRLGALERILGKFSQIYSKMYSYKQTIEHEGSVTTNTPAIMVLDYSKSMNNKEKVAQKADIVEIETKES